ncbi:MAG: hypothetical protein ED557_07870 [Balneola sp.]|nr:MAG: hypothetical protein ED557_07870 [Balneola sp.]
MTGLIWTIQLVHYPSFYFVDRERFKEFHIFHSKRISILVVPLMIFELISSGILWWESSAFSLNSLGFYLVIAIWISTAAFSVPAHNKLSSEMDKKTIRILVNTNWIRTLLWTIKASIGVYFLSLSL